MVCFYTAVGLHCHYKLSWCVQFWPCNIWSHTMSCWLYNFVWSVSVNQAWTYNNVHGICEQMRKVYILTITRIHVMKQLFVACFNISSMKLTYHTLYYFASGTTDINIPSFFITCMNMTMVLHEEMPLSFMCWGAVLLLACWEEMNMKMKC